ncbi:MAG: Hsp20/alpha crystallin family protein [Ignavibacteria bacterium]|nr:Hsp20/alpha crystallin family protein [Ignavibacteria bacterium]
MTKEKEVAVVQNATPSVVGPASDEVSYVRPSTDVYETGEAYVIIVDMPGVAKDSIHVRLEKDLLMIKGATDMVPRDRTGLLFTEIRKAGYARSFNLGEGIDRNSIEGRYENGVLTIKLHKKEEMRPKEISIR